MKDLRRLTLEEKVGQLFFIGFQGTTPDANTRALLELVRPGGIVLSQRNLENFEQFSTLANGFVDGVSLPAFVGIAQEGGAADRLKQLFAPLPSIEETAQYGTAAVRLLARVIASQLECLGFNTGFAPVLDVAGPGSILGDRAISASPGEVTRLGSVFADEFAGKQILACPKHFPGIGSATIDPHFSMPTIQKAKRELLQFDILPFLNLIDEVPMMMVGHAHYPGLGDSAVLPASLSPRVVDGLLRRKLGFGGVIITDDMTMGSVNRVGLTPELFQQAFEAGNDMLLFSQSTPLVEQSFRVILRSVRQSDVLRSQLDASVGRIIDAKRKIRLVPVSGRAHLRIRVLRQIDKLWRTIRIPSRLERFTITRS